MLKILARVSKLPNILMAAKRPGTELVNLDVLGPYGHYQISQCLQSLDTDGIALRCFCQNQLVTRITQSRLTLNDKINDWRTMDLDTYKRVVADRNPKPRIRYLRKNPAYAMFSKRKDFWKEANSPCKPVFAPYNKPATKN